MESFGDPPLLISMLVAMDAEEKAGRDPKSTQLADLLPMHMRPVLQHFPSPHPLVETRQEFRDRATSAWDDAVQALEKQGVSLAVPRKLKQHCEWLVRYQVLGETAASIVEGLDKTESSTVYKAVKALARIIELPIRAVPEDLK
jgi:hypothetical protein